MISGTSISRLECSNRSTTRSARVVTNAVGTLCITHVSGLDLARSRVYGTGLKSPQLNNALTHIGFDRDRTDKQKFCVTAKYAQSYLIEKDLQDLTRECRTSRVLVCYAKFSIL
jgi:hypothetical protein